MLQDNFVSALLSSLLMQSPAIAAQLVGLIVALVYMGRYPLPSLLVIVAVVLMLTISVIWPLGQQWMFMLGRNQGWGPAEIQRASLALNFVFSILRAGTLLLLVTAVFVRRSAALVLNPPRGLA